MDVLDWLLEPDTPGVAFLARRDLLDEDPKSPVLRDLRACCNDYPPVAGMLDQVDAAIAAGDYAKYQGAYWTLIFLGEMVAEGDDPRVRRLGEHVLATQLENGGFTVNAKAVGEIVCLTANVLRSLVVLGYADDPRIARGYRRLAERILPVGGVPCRVMDDYGVDATCFMTLPQTLRCVAAAPAAVASTPEVVRLQELLTSLLVGVRAYRYVRPDLQQYRDEALPGRPKGQSVKEFNAAYLAQHPVALEERLPKPGWLRLGFPSHYNSDVLESLLALAEAGVEMRPELEDALAVLESRRGKDGRWKLERTLNGKMLAEVEHKGQPSKWLTVRALTVLRAFGRFAVSA